MKSRAFQWTTLWIAVFGLVPLTAETPPPELPARHVDDRTGFLRPETFSRLDQRLVDLERRTGLQIVVTLLPSLPTGEVLEDYVRRVFDAWRIGETNRDNGILFAVFVEDHRMRIEVGSGLSRRVPNALAARILRDSVAPHFRSNDLDGGVTAGVNALLRAMHAAPIRAAEVHPMVAAPAGVGSLGLGAHLMNPKAFQQQIDDQQLVDAIVEAEKGTSGEIRVFIRRSACVDPLAAAHAEFDRQGMKKTPLRNAVLIYLVPASRQFAVAADEGIHLRCGEVFWKSVAAEMAELLRDGRYTEGVLAGIRRAGQELGRHFPKFPGDRDDLPNTVIRD